MRRSIVFVILSFVFFGIDAVAQEISAPIQSVDSLLREAGRNIPREIPFTLAYLDIKPLLVPHNGGASTIRIRFSPNLDCGESNFTVRDLDNLQYLGNPTWTDYAQRGETTYFDLQLVLPARDTSGFFIDVTCNSARITTVPVFFLPEGDTLSLICSNVKACSYAEPHQTGRHSYGPTDEEVLRKMARQKAIYDATQPWDTTVAWYRDSSGNYSLRKIDFSRKLPRNAREKKEWLERSPLEDQEMQSIVVDGKVYQRKRGETRFHEVQPIRDLRSLRDSTPVVDPNQKYHIVILFINAEDSVFVSGLVDSLVAVPDRPGLYHTETNRGVISELRKKGISFDRYSNYLLQLPPSSRDSLEKQK